MYPTQKKQEEDEKEVASGWLEDGGRGGSAEGALVRSAATIDGLAGTVDVGLVCLHPAAVDNCLILHAQDTKYNANHSS